MNDPHVKSLHYRVVVEKNVDYKNAAPLSATTEDFDFTLDGKTAVFEMKEHYSTADEAKAVVEQYIRAWDILIGLEQDPGDLRLAFDHADIIDRSPNVNDKNINSLNVNVSSHVNISGHLSLHVSRSKYPTFPKNFIASIEAEIMYLRYKAYRENREPLNHMAYMCLTIIERRAGGRKEAARRYNIEYTVLDTLGNLSSTKGDKAEARKFPKDGVFKSLRPKEKDWIVSVIKALVRRVGEYAHDPKANLKKLSMGDFPDLSTK